MSPGPKVVKRELFAEPWTSTFEHIFYNRPIVRSGPARYTYQLSNVAVITQEGLIFWNNKLIDESTAWPRYEVLATQSLLSSRRVARFRRLAGVHIALPSTPYYHWLVEDLPSVIASLVSNPDAALLIPNDARSYVHEFSKLSGETVQVRGGVLANEAVFTSKAGIVGTPQAGDVKLLRGYIQRLGLLDERDKDSRIYISRRFSKRPLPNEFRIEEKFTNYGFEVVHLERLSWEEQLSACSRANVIVGPHGAGLANALFAEKGATLHEIMLAGYPNNCFELLASAAGLKYSRTVIDGINEVDVLAIVEGL